LFFAPGVARWDLLLLMVLLGAMGLAGASTLLAALVAKTGTRGALFVVLALPVLLPLLVMAIAGTTSALMGGRHTPEAYRNLIGLTAYTVAMVTASLMLFPYAWED
jgi:heme exporter protein B